MIYPPFWLVTFIFLNEYIYVHEYIIMFNWRFPKDVNVYHSGGGGRDTLYNIIFK